MHALHTLGDYLRHASQDSGAQSVCPRITILVCTERTGWRLTPYTGGQRSTPVITVSRHTARITDGTAEVELYRTGRANILELVTTKGTDGRAVVSAILHNRPGVRLAHLAQDRARRLRRRPFLQKAPTRKTRS